MDSAQSAREPERPEQTDKTSRYAGRQAILTRHERHPAGGSTIREVVFGANDGLISSLALVSGMAGATPNRSTILIAGLAGVVAGTVSMALGAFVSTKSVREFQESEEQRERYEIEHVPELEREELAEIYRQKGFTGAELERVLDRLTENPERWLGVMMAEELGLAGEVLNPYVAAMVMGVAFALGGIVPVLSYFWSEGAVALVTSVGLTAVGLFGVGCWRGALANSSWFRKGLEMVCLGGLSFALSYGIGWLLGVSI